MMRNLGDPMSRGHPVLWYIDTMADMNEGWHRGMAILYVPYIYAYI